MIVFVCLLSVSPHWLMRAGALSVLFIAVSRSICGGLAHCRIWKIFIEWMSNHWWFIIVQITTELTSVSFSLLPLILGIPPEIVQITRSVPSFSKSLHTLGCQSSLIEAYFAQFPHQLVLWHGFGVWSSSRLSITGSFWFCCWYPALDTRQYVESGER